MTLRWLKGEPLVSRHKELKRFLSFLTCSGLRDIKLLSVCDGYNLVKLASSFREEAKLPVILNILPLAALDIRLNSR